MTQLATEHKVEIMTDSDNTVILTEAKGIKPGNRWIGVREHFIRDMIKEQRTSGSS